MNKEKVAKYLFTMMYPLSNWDKATKALRDSFLVSASKIQAINEEEEPLGKTEADISHLDSMCIGCLARTKRKSCAGVLVGYECREDEDEINFVEPETVFITEEGKAYKGGTPIKPQVIRDPDGIY